MSNGFRRISTGVDGLDEMVGGGFPFPSVALVAGSAGTGKTTFAMEFLVEGAKKGEQCLFFTTLSEPTQWMLRYAGQFDFIDKEFFGKEIQYVDMGLLLQSDGYEDILDFIDDKIAEIMPQRIVIDPITVVGMFFEEDYRSFLFELTNLLKNWQAVTVLTGEVNPGETYPPQITYAVDSVILLSMLEEESSRRKYLEVLKMRGTDHTTGKQPISITTEDGIIVLKSRF
ncbi:MAG: RAD55 family ATPase [Candidatus Saliniplasma sp.]